MIKMKNRDKIKDQVRENIEYVFNGTYSEEYERVYICKVNNIDFEDLKYIVGDYITIHKVKGLVVGANKAKEDMFIQIKVSLKEHIYDLFDILVKELLITSPPKEEGKDDEG